MTHVSFSLHSPKSRLYTVSYTLGKKTPLTYDQLVIGFAIALAEFMLNNETITESDLLEKVSLIGDALVGMKIGDQK